MPDNDRFVAGQAVRRAVLGDEHVERSAASAGPFGAPMQELTTEYCWGYVWTRPGLDRRVRSLLNVAMLTALKQPRELQLHLKGAINNGCTVEQIQEVLLQAAVYCGVPAALDAFAIANEVLKPYVDAEPIVND